MGMGRTWTGSRGEERNGWIARREENACNFVGLAIIDNELEGDMASFMSCRSQ
jgi:hypothetical protein